MWDRRVVRRMPWRRAPLRRGTDRVQEWLTLVLILVALMVVPWVAWWTGSTTYGAQVRASEWEAQHRHTVVAVVAQDAPDRSPTSGNALPGPQHVPVLARWTGPDGTLHWGTVRVWVGTRAGSTLTVWVDQHGALTSPPRRRHPTLDASLAATFALTAVIALLGGVRRIVVWRLDRCRLRSWEAEWQIVGPRWSRR